VPPTATSGARCDGRSCDARVRRGSLDWIAPSGELVGRTQTPPVAETTQASRPSQVIEYSFEPATAPPPSADSPEPPPGTDSGALAATARNPQETGGLTARFTQAKPVRVLLVRCTGVYMRPVEETMVRASSGVL